MKIVPTYPDQTNFTQDGTNSPDLGVGSWRLGVISPASPRTRPALRSARDRIPVPHAPPRRGAARAALVVARPLGQARPFGSPLSREVRPVGGHGVGQLAIGSAPTALSGSDSRDVPNMYSISPAWRAPMSRAVAGMPFTVWSGRHRDLPVERVAIHGSARRSS